MTTTIYVCTTCKLPNDTASERAGQRLYNHLAQALDSDQHDVIIEPVECLSVCKRPCTVAFSAPNKWTYVYGDFSADEAVDMLLGCAALYGATSDGLIPWKERPDALKKGVIARLPSSLTMSKKTETPQ